MGQQASSEHAPLTFGYVKHSINEEQDETINEDLMNRQDFVLDNPHLYQLQTLCKQCNSSREVIISSLVNESCNKCQKQKRLSLVKKDLADDLNYIDQTYYPDLIHYNSTISDPMEIELLDYEKDTDISRLTIGEATYTPGGTMKRRPRRLTGPSMAVDLSNRSLVKLSPSIGYLDSLTKLNLSNNQMTCLPEEIGYLKNLRVLNISNNSIEEIPDTITFLTKMKALNVSNNHLQKLPVSIGYLPKLVIIIANNNRLTSLPREFTHLTQLVSLNVSNNPLKSIPAEIAAIKSLRKLLTDDCEFAEDDTNHLLHNPPSLFETCSRIITRHQQPIPNQLADHIKQYLTRADTCSHCHGPFFDSFVTRTRFIERRARQSMVLEYTLCSAHWSDENDRVLAMFANQPDTSVNKINKQSINTDGLSEDVCQKTLRHRAYSDLTPSISRNNSFNSEYPPTTDYFPISLLKTPPNLPALPQEEQNSYLKANRQRSSSTASMTKKFSNFITRSSSSNSISRGRSGSGSSTHSLSSMFTPPILKRTTTNLRDWSNSSSEEHITFNRHNTMPLETL